MFNLRQCYIDLHYTMVMALQKYITSEIRFKFITYGEGFIFVQWVFVWNNIVMSACS